MCRRIAKKERAKRDEARSELATCRDQPPVVKHVEVEVTPTWAWITLGVAAAFVASAVGGIVYLVETN
jgi:hypothetical protein